MPRARGGGTLRGMADEGHPGVGAQDASDQARGEGAGASGPVGATAQARCLNCGEPPTGAYCAVCGQSARTGRLTLRDALFDAVEAVTDLDRPLWRTFVGLCLRPGVVAAEYAAGKRKRYVSPVKFALVCAAVEIVLIRIARPEAINSAPQTGIRSAQMYSEFSAAMFDFLGIVTLVTMPFLAFLMSSLFPRARRTVGESMALCLYVHGMCYLVQGLCTAIVPVSPRLTMGVTSFLPVVLLAWGARPFYGEGGWSAAWKSGLAYLAYAATYTLAFMGAFVLVVLVDIVIS